MEKGSVANGEIVKNPMSFYPVPAGKTPANWAIPVCKIRRLNLSIPSKTLFATEPIRGSPRL
jgi:hypothetical protein